MQFRLVANIIGVLLVFVALSMAIGAIVAAFYRGEDLFAFSAAACVTFVVGVIMYFSTRRGVRGETVTHRSAFAIVSLGWLFSCVFGALPFFFYAHMPAVFNAETPAALDQKWDAGESVQFPPDCRNNRGLGREFCSFTNAVFESVSGFTTTGATILEAGLWQNHERRAGELPHGLLFWRALTHFLGGMGIIVLGVAILPLLGVGGMQLFKAEVPGPVKDKMAPRVTETARLLWKVYAGLTLLEVLLLLTTGQGPFLAVCHAFATMATGGFSPLAASVEGLHSPWAEWIILVFMFLAGVNFQLHFLSLRKRRPIHWHDEEFRIYLRFALVGAGLLAVVLYRVEGFNAHDSAREGLFQTLTVLTTTGFSTSDFALWGIWGQVLLFALFFVGGSSGSTGGGIKVVRISLMMKAAFRELKRLSHPHGVIQTKMGGKVVEDSVVYSVAGFVMLYIATYMISTIIFGLNGYDLVTSLTAAGATLGNIGPGLGPIGPAGNYNFFSDPLKWLCIFDMLAGRLEIYSVFILLTPAYWAK